LTIPCKRGEGEAVAAADIRHGGDLEKELTGIKLLQGGAGVAGLKEAGHEELVALTLELETWCKFIQLDPEGAGELPSVREPGRSSNALEGAIRMREEGTAETNFEFQLFEGAPNQGAREILWTVGNEKDLLEMIDALGVEQVGDAHAKHVFWAEEKGVGKGPVETKCRETCANRGHDLVTLLQCETGSRKRISQFAEKRRIEAEPSHGAVTTAETGAVCPSSGDIPKELELSLLEAIRSSA
jgi:hypothetical protein